MWNENRRDLLFISGFVKSLDFVSVRFLPTWTYFLSRDQFHSFIMTADAHVYAPLTNAVFRAPAVKQPAMRPVTAGKKPWRETPLVESANLSEAAGWYGAHHSTLLSLRSTAPLETRIAKLEKQNLPQARDVAALGFLQEPWHRPLLPSSPGTFCPPRRRTLLRIVRRQRRSGLRVRSQILRMSIDSSRPSLD